MKCRRIAIIAVAVAVTAGLSGCSNYATPEPSQKALAYTGGDWSNNKFEKCVEPGERTAYDLGGYAAYYPVGDRKWVFSTAPGADSGPIMVSTKGLNGGVGQELVQSGVIIFELNTSCAAIPGFPGGILQQFHERVARPANAAFGEDATVIPPGWSNLLQTYLGGPANRTMDGQGTQYTWEQLYTDATIQNTWLEAVKQEIPKQLADLSGGADYFRIKSIQLDRPDLPEALKQQFRQAEIDRQDRQRNAENQQAANNFPGGPAAQQEWRAREADIALKEAEAACLANAQCPKILNTVPR